MSKSSSSTAAYYGEDLLQRQDDARDSSSSLDYDFGADRFQTEDDELRLLKERQAELEKKRREAKQLDDKRSAVQHRRRELSDRLHQHADIIDQKTLELQTLLNELNFASTQLDAAMERVESLPPDIQKSRPEDLDQSLAVLEEAQSVYSKALRRIGTLRSDLLEDPESSESSGPGILGDDRALAWLQRGAAFTLPLVASLALLLFLARWLFL